MDKIIRENENGEMRSVMMTFDYLYGYIMDAFLVIMGNIKIE